MTLNFLNLIEKPVICVLDRRETRFDNGSAALDAFHDDQYEARQIEPAGDAIRVVLMDREEVRGPFRNAFYGARVLDG